MENLIIHISGASGSGKTTLGNKLKEHFKSKIIVKDLDILRDEFIKEFYGNKKWTYIDENEYQSYIDDYINKQKKPIIFVGLNDNTIYGKNKNLYYNVHSQHNYYIKIDDMIIVKQKCIRLLNDIQTDKMAMEDLVKNNEKFVKQFTKAIKIECSATQTIKQNNKWKKDYEKQDYKFMSRENIYKSVVKILNNKTIIKYLINNELNNTRLNEN
jgi:adenylate kinase family enzyme